MNNLINKFGKFLLILTLPFFISTIYGSEGRKRRAADDSNLDPKRIKMDPAFLAELDKAKALAEKKNKKDKADFQAPDQGQNRKLLSDEFLAKFSVAKSKKENEPVNLNFIKIPDDIQNIIAQYLKDDWYLYYGQRFECEKYVDDNLVTDESYKIKKICFSDDNKLLITGEVEKEKENVELHKIFNLTNKCFEKHNFMRLSPKSMYSKRTTRDSYVTRGAYNVIKFSAHESEFENETMFYLNKEYFSLDKIKARNCFFSLSSDIKYIAYACPDFFIIWDAHRFNGELKEENIVTKYNINPEKQDRTHCYIQCLSFSECSKYLAINLNVDGEDSLYFIYDLANRSLVDLSYLRTLVYTIAFSRDSKFFARGGYGDLCIFKRRENGFE